MTKYSELSKEDLTKEKESLEAQYKEICEKGYSLSMARGKPSSKQLSLSEDILTYLNSDGINEAVAAGEFDPRNYGGLTGLKCAREFLGNVVGRDAEDVICFGNSSLNVMFDMISRAYSKGIMGNTPWCKLPKVKFLCPAPGYDRHFAITEYFGIEMIPIAMNEDGPDMDKIEELVNNDDSVKGVWCVPKFSNPQGYVFSDETVKRFAALSPAAKDFRIFWDNAYCIHYLYEPVEILDILEEANKCNNSDIVYEFMSLSKVTFSGGSVSAVITSKNNRDDITSTLTVQTIGHDKLNQLRHVNYFRDHSLKEHMEKHADILRPKFEVVEAALDSEIIPRGIGSYYKPKGGYFITFKSENNCAKRIVELAKDAGMEMTPAGACFPYGNDPEDAYIRIAPSFPSVEEMKTASEIFTVCVRLASVERYLDK